MPTRGPAFVMGSHRRGSPAHAAHRINPKVSVSVVFVAAMFMNIMDITIVNVALPSIGRQFHVSETALDAVAVGYLVSLAVFIPAAGWLGDRFGSKRVLLFAIAVFTGGLGPLRPGRQPLRAGVLPGPPGGRRRDADPGRHGHAVPDLPTRGAGAGLEHPDRAHRGGPGPGSGPRRAAGDRPLVAVGLLRQPPHRDRWPSPSA